MNKRWIIRCLTVFLVVAVIFAPARAVSQSKQLTVEQLTEGAEVIALGRVTALNSEWSNNGTRIVTRVTFAVEQSLKGDPSQTTLTIVVPGGEIDNVGEVYSHAPRFSQNETLIVFAKTDSNGLLRVTGGEQGKIQVWRDERTGTMLVGKGEVLEAFKTRISHAIKPMRQE